jgi:outer membrane protein assembly factor BamE (lipoprotein component of BamABCDE complex)
MLKKIVPSICLGMILTVSPTVIDLVLAQSPQTTQVQVVPVVKVGLGKIRPGMSEKAVRTILGKPTSTKTQFSPGVGDNIRTLQYPNISLSLVPNTNNPKNFFVYQFATRSRKFLTPAGIKVGDTRSQVIKAYGKPTISQDGKVTYLTYPVGSKDSVAGFTFSIESGKVIKIEYGEQLT